MRRLVAPGVPRRGTDWLSRQDRVHSPRHFSSAIAQIVNFLGTMQNEWAGSQECSSFDSYRAPFTNLTFDWVCPEDLREQVTVIGEVEQDFNHGNLAEEMAVIKRASIDVMTAVFGTPYFQNFIPGDHRKHVQPGGHTGGTVLHLYMSEKLCTAAACRELVQRSLTTHRLPYITVTPSFSICPRPRLPGRRAPDLHGLRRRL
ncbi:anaerobic ribonucleoside-triphosphate reductase [Cryobacterium sp. M96]|uniref:anaerobic ribonucleoside-triphosphate reductase n=1 Tax=Cryobacterium sp. M96 TaxID=2048295 RepID=UPI0035147D2F